MKQICLRQQWHNCVYKYIQQKRIVKGVTMKDHKIFKTPIIPVLLLIIGLNYYTHNLLLSIIIGICIYILASLIDHFSKKR